jgi:hypothetical protein
VTLTGVKLKIKVFRHLTLSVTGQVAPDDSKECTAFKTSVTVHPMTRHHVPEDLNHQQHHCKNPARILPVADTKALQLPA